jgi:diaminopimelate epimerase
LTRFFKGHGLGNDYIAVELDEMPFALTPAVVRLLCDRHLGIGSDGVLGRTGSSAADFGVRIFNPDGSEAEKSGNGLRILARYLLEREEVQVGRRFSVETLGGVVRMIVLERRADSALVEVEMGRASFRSAAVGLPGPDREVEGEKLELEAGDRVAINTVSIGNPHCVIFEDVVDVEDLRRRAPQISTHPWFEQGVNVQFARIVGPGTVEAWVWERGAGETSASGSSACAVAAAAVRRGLVTAREVEVRMPGGTLQVNVGEDWDLVLRGPVEAVCDGVIVDEMLTRLRSV